MLKEAILSKNGLIEDTDERKFALH